MKVWSSVCKLHGSQEIGSVGWLPSSQNDTWVGSQSVQCILLTLTSVELKQLQQNEESLTQISMIANMPRWTQMFLPVER
eukprot:3140591-Ditylum_brightwellii.AAC.1